MSENTTPGIIVKTDFVTASSSIFSGYIDYIDRDNAVRNDHISDFSLYNDYMDNPEKTSDLFTANSDHLSYTEKQNYKHLYESAQENGSPMWQTVISFDNHWLEEQGLYKSQDGYLDKTRIMNYTRHAVKDMLDSEKLNTAVWTAAIHYNTDNLHVHIATVEPIPTREKMHIKTIRFNPRWVEQNDILQGESVSLNKKVPAHKTKNYAYRNIQERITARLDNDGYITKNIGDYITVNADGSIDLSYNGENKDVPEPAELIDDHWEYRGKFKQKSIDKCKSRMANQIVNSADLNKKINETIRDNIAAAMKGDILFENKEIVDRYVELYKRMGEYSKRYWGYGWNKIPNLRQDLDKITELFIQKYKADEYIKLNKYLDERVEVARREFGNESKAAEYKATELNELFKRCGNAIIEQMKTMSNAELHELEAKTYIAAEIEEAAATNDKLDFDGRIDYGKSNYENKSKYWTDNFKLAKNLLFKCLAADDLEIKEEGIKAAIGAFQHEVDNENWVAAYEMARCYRLGTFGEIDTDKAESYYKQAFEGFSKDLQSDRYHQLLIEIHDYNIKHPDSTYQQREKDMFRLHKELEREDWLQNYLYYRVGRMYLSGEGTEKDVAQGINHLEQSDSTFAYYSLGSLYYQGKEIEADYEKAYELFSLAGFPEENAKGMPFAKYNMAEMLDKGLVADDKLDKDFLYRSAMSDFMISEQSSPNDLTEYKIASMLLSGKGYEPDEELAKEYLLKSADFGNTYAQIKLASLYKDEDSFKAVNLLQIAASSGNHIAQYQLGKLYTDREGEHFDVNKGLDMLERAAEQENEFAQYALGDIYLKGEVVEQDISKALEYLKASAVQNNQFAQYKLGVYYVNEENNLSEGVEYLTRSAEQGNEYAQYQLGKLYHNEEYGFRDIYQSLIYFTKAAEQGNQYAQYQLGVIYYKDEDIEQSPELATHYFERSAEQGNEYAQYTLGVIYLNGEIVSADVNRAVMYLERAAEQDNQFAQYQLGKIYYFGAEGIEADREKALKYLNRSAEQGNEYAKALLEWKPGIYNSYFHGQQSFSDSFIGLSSDMRRLFERLSNEHDHMLNQTVHRKLEKEKQKDNQIEQ